MDLTVTAGGFAAWWGAELLKSDLGSTRCRWCNIPGLDQGAREALLWDDPASADRWSNLVVHGVLPVTLVGMSVAGAAKSAHPGSWAVDALIIAESVALAGVLIQAAKYLVDRERPFVHVLSAPEKARTENPGDNNASFPSSHTGVAFAMAVSGGTVASLRGYEHQGWVWGTGLSLAALTGYLRVAADKHYFTDVAAGAALGSAVGFLVPTLFHGPRDDPDKGIQVTMHPTRGGGAFSIAWRL